MFSALIEWVGSVPTSVLTLCWSALWACDVRRSCLELLVMFRDWPNRVLDGLFRGHPVLLSTCSWSACLWASWMAPHWPSYYQRTSLCDNNHWDLKRFEVCEDLGLLVCQKKRLSYMRTMLYSQEIVERKWGSFWLLWADIRSVWLQETEKWE